MNIIIKKIAGLILFSTVVSTGFCQYNWKLSRDKEGIKIYLSETANSKFKSVKVECILAGNYDKLIAALTDVDHLKDWVYNTKKSFILKKVNPYEMYYYTETSIPWPMSNRDVVIHVKIYRDSLQRFLRIVSVNEPNYFPEKDGKVRVPHLSINWYVTMPAAKTISIVYILEADPGGSVPAWLVNDFADKGPYETFKKLAAILKK
jgi:hypothetical protein